MTIPSNLFNKIFNIYFSTITFRYIEQFFLNFFSFNLSSYNTAAVHALNIIFFSISMFITNSSILKNVIINLSSGYFLADCISNIKNSNISLNNFGYLSHHLITIYLLNFTNIDKILLIMGLFTLEVSNLPNYIVYPLIKYKADPKIISFFKKIQFIVYSIFRFFSIIPIVYYYKKKNFNNFFLFNMVLIYLMGVYWTYKLYKKL
jgi:hypothetical protein